MIISRNAILQEKQSGSYGCPNFIDPKCGRLLLSHLHIEANDETVLLFTEVMENFGIEVARLVKPPVTAEAIKAAISDIQFEK